MNDYRNALSAAKMGVYIFVVTLIISMPVEKISFGRSIEVGFMMAGGCVVFGFMCDLWEQYRKQGKDS